MLLRCVFAFCGWLRVVDCLWLIIGCSLRVVGGVLSACCCWLVGCRLRDACSVLCINYGVWIVVCNLLIMACCCLFAV